MPRLTKEKNEEFTNRFIIKNTGTEIKIKTINDIPFILMEKDDLANTLQNIVNDRLWLIEYSKNLIADLDEAKELLSRAKDIIDYSRIEGGSAIKISGDIGAFLAEEKEPEKEKDCKGCLVKITGCMKHMLDGFLDDIVKDKQ